MLWLAVLWPARRPRSLRTNRLAKWRVIPLSVLARVPEATVRKIFASRQAKPVIALVWHARLSMRLAFHIQSFVMKLSAGELLPARAGVHFPMTEDEMRWHLGYFGVPV